MDYTVDRIEGELAVLVSIEDSSVIRVRLCELDRVREGDALRTTENGFIRLEDVTEKRKRDIASRFEKLKRK